MYDRIVDKINDGWFLAFCILPFVICGYILKDVTMFFGLCIIWALTIVVFVGQIIGGHRWGLGRYKVSQGTINLLAIQYSILWIALAHYKIHEALWSNADLCLRIILCVVAGFYIVMNVWIWRGFIFEKEEKVSETREPEVNLADLPQDAQCVFSAVECYANLIRSHREEVERLKEIKIPIPQKPSDDDQTPFVSYLKSLSETPKYHPEFAALEQFALMVADNSNLSDFGSDLVTNLSHMSDSGFQYASGIKDLLVDSRNSISDFIVHHDKDTAHDLMQNVCHWLSRDFHSPKFKLDFTHAHGFGGKLEAFLKHAASDTGKGAFQTFTDADKWHELNENISEAFSSDIDNIAESLVTNVDIDVWGTDFNGDAHFPVISTCIEMCRLGSKYMDGDVDMEKAAIKSGVKIGGTAGGAYIGGTLGTILCPIPGVGTAVGAMVGGWLGRFAANKINFAETKRLQEELSRQVDKVKDAAKQAKSNILGYQQETTNNVADIARKESEKFEELKSETPLMDDDENLMLYTSSLIVKEYLVMFIEQAELRYGTSKSKEIEKLKGYLPTTDQLKLYPRESFGLTLSAQNFIRDNFEEDENFNAELINEACLESIVKRISLSKTLQAIWYNQVFVGYKNAISKIMKDSDNCIAEYIRKVDKEKEILDREVKVAEDLAHELENEKKTN